jgi:hypothetical protein
MNTLFVIGHLHAQCDQKIGPKLMVEGFGRSDFAQCGVNYAKQEGA